MEYRELDNIDILVPRIGLDTWGISGEGYTPVVKGEVEKIVHTAIDNGVNFTDTADSYGKSEEIIRKVLYSRKDRETVVATKFGWDFYQRSGVVGNLDRRII